jgi:pimeloyl-ACP methyl ester carboxylesterase
MAIIDVGAGPPVVLIPGIQGRWEWMRPAVDALAHHCRVITFSLPGEPPTGVTQETGPGFDIFLRQIDDALDDAKVTRAAICGVSFGGLIAVRYAARRTERVQALVLVSALSPRWRPDDRDLFYMGAPRRRAPLFFVRAVGRARPELRATFPGLRERWAFALRYGRLIVTAPASPRHMSLRAKIAAAEDFVEDCGRIAAPTLVLSGEPDLDRVVPVETTLEYVKSIPGARSAMLEGTGHLGLATRPDRFAAIVGQFVADHSQPSHTALIDAADRPVGDLADEMVHALDDPAGDSRGLLRGGRT